jgi:hypothetical protein
MLNPFFNIENALNLDHRILACLAVLMALSVLLTILGIRQLLRKKIIIASIQSLTGVTLLLASLLLLSIATNLYSYDRLTYEENIADLTFKQLDKQQFLVKITYKNKPESDQFHINGDEWQIDARVIKWHGLAQLLGLNAQYRLERISGRYSDIEDELQKPRSVYALGLKDEIDYWKLVNDYKKWLPWVDAYYGSAVYLPMADNITYSVSLSQTGLIARPTESSPHEKLKRW